MTFATKLAEPKLLGRSEPSLPEWPEPDLSEPEEANGSPLPDTDTLLAELGAFYPVVSYPAVDEDEHPEDAINEVIFAGLVYS